MAKLQMIDTRSVPTMQSGSGTRIVKVQVTRMNSGTIGDMAELVHNCPRCGSRQITFDVLASANVRKFNVYHVLGEGFSVCRGCRKATIFILKEQASDVSTFVNRIAATNAGSITGRVAVEGYVSLKDVVSAQPPAHLPAVIESAFREGAVCASVQCYNAAATMFRLCIDLASRALLPPVDDASGPKPGVRRSLGLRLPWLFESGRLDRSLEDLSNCIKEDGNDGAHEGTLAKEDLEDLQDFTVALLERLYTEPARLRLARERRDARRQLGAPAD